MQIASRRFYPSFYPRLNPHFGPGRHRGAVLVVGLIFLAMLTLMGVAAYSVATQEERMTGNARDRLKAFEAAEAALRVCEDQLANVATPPPATGSATDAAGSKGYYLRLPATQPSYGDASYPGGPWWVALGAAGVKTVAATEITGVTSPPVCIAEYYGVDPGTFTSGGKPIKQVPMWRISAHGWGQNTSTQVTLQTTYLQ